jgi:hypothetical protein
MRTTLTIDDDLVRRLRTRANRAGISFKDAVAIALRHGLDAVGTSPKRAYKTRTFSLGHPPRGDLDRALDLAESLESEEIARKLELRK